MAIGTHIIPVLLKSCPVKVISGIDTGEQFNPLAVKSCQWTRDALTEENLKYLRGLPEGPLSVNDELWLAHGTPLDEDAYILNEFDAIEAFRGFPEDICFFGHSHIPTIFSIDESDSLFLLTPMSDEERVALKPGSRYLINCGSVGQPRDGDWRASYVIYDIDSRNVTFRRLEYDLETAQKKILAARLPEGLAARIAEGR